MNKLRKIKQNSIELIVALSVFVLTLTFLGYQSSKSPQILGENTTVTANVYACRLDILVQPEQRTIGNWPTYLNVKIHSEDGNSLIGNFDTNTDNFGFASVNLCDLATPIYLTAGTYIFEIKGYSHLTKLFLEVTGFTKVLNIIDFTIQGELIAGDTNTPQDDEINSLDSTHLIRTIGEVNGNPNYNIKYDLNLDGVINNLDIEILIDNFYKQGESLN